MVPAWGNVLGRHVVGGQAKPGAEQGQLGIPGGQAQQWGHERQVSTGGHTGRAGMLGTLGWGQAGERTVQAAGEWGGEGRGQKRCGKGMPRWQGKGEGMGITGGKGHGV